MILNASIVVPIVFSSAGVHFNIDFLSKLSDIFYFNKILHNLTILFRHILISRYVGYRVWHILAQTLIAGGVFLQIPLRLTSTLSKIVQQHSRFSAKKYALNINVLMRIHTEIAIVCAILSHIGRFVIPFLMQIGLIQVVIADYSTIKLYSAIGMPWFLGMPCLSLVIKAILSFLAPNASGIFEHSENFRKALANIVQSKYHKRKLRSIRSARIQIGSLCHWKKSTKSTYFTTMIHTTIDAILLW
jgi:hypothetical protein